MGRRIPLGLGFKSPFIISLVLQLCVGPNFGLKRDWVGCKMVSMLIIVGCNVQRYSLQSILLISFHFTTTFFSSFLET
jgi:hypothetical protein